MFGCSSPVRIGGRRRATTRHCHFGGSSRVIFYTFGAAEPEDYERASFISDKLYVIRVGGTRMSDAGAKTP